MNVELNIVSDRRVTQADATVGNVRFEAFAPQDRDLGALSARPVEACEAYFSWGFPGRGSLPHDTKQNMRYYLQSCIAWMNARRQSDVPELLASSQTIVCFTKPRFEE